jgi:hypothetical protein
MRRTARAAPRRRAAAGDLFEAEQPRDTRQRRVDPQAAPDDAALDEMPAEFDDEEIESSDDDEGADGADLDEDEMDNGDGDPWEQVELLLRARLRIPLSPAPRGRKKARG